ncbi:MAG: DUF4124 domain-containing protein [Betaproteobacteria bacterium]|jgi:hypothetical protein
MIYRIVLLLGFVSISAWSYAEDIYKWIDDQGRVQYGQQVPAKYKSAATKIEVKIPEPTPAERKQAAARAAKNRTKEKSIATREPKTPKPRPEAPPAAAVAATAEGETGRCEAQWKRYRESEACFAPYRSNAGTLNSEAFQHCVVVKEPTC